MPSLEEKKRLVRESLETQADELDHADILAGLQHEIDKHNAIKGDLRATMHREKRQGVVNRGDEAEASMRFRFKSGTAEPRKRKHRSGKHREEDSNGRHTRRRISTTSTPSSDTETAHPFPREPTSQDPPDLDPSDAFRESLFDALADDEGAQYWEGVYSQPIHVYARPTVETARGELEQMNDEEYAAYVKLKMWEKSHPHVVLERERAERKRRLKEEEQTRQREEFVRRREQAAWERGQGRSARAQGVGSDDEAKHEYRFAGDKEYVSEASSDQNGRHSDVHSSQEYQAAWSNYLNAWDKLKHELLAERSAGTKRRVDPSKRIPWPIIAGKAVVNANIEDFMRHAPFEDAGRSALQLLKMERVRWHPDKVQQRFGEQMDAGCMKLVTAVFQVVDSLFEEERARASGNK